MNSIKNRLLTTLLAVLAVACPAVQAVPIQAGQMIRIAIIGVPPGEASRINNNYLVDESGIVRLWGISDMKASGLSATALAKKIEQAYRSAEIYTNPTIQIFTDSGDALVQELVTVGGRVRSPGPKPFQTGMTLFQAIMAAGGPTDFGASNRVKLYRNGKVYEYDLTKGDHKLLKVYPNDTIDVPHKNWRGR